MRESRIWGPDCRLQSEIASERRDASGVHDNQVDGEQHAGGHRTRVFFSVFVFSALLHARGAGGCGSTPICKRACGYVLERGLAWRVGVDVSLNASLFLVGGLSASVLDRGGTAEEALQGADSGEAGRGEGDQGAARREDVGHMHGRAGVRRHALGQVDGVGAQSAGQRGGHPLPRPHHPRGAGQAAARPRRLRAAARGAAVAAGHGRGAHRGADPQRLGRPGGARAARAAFCAGHGDPPGQEQGEGESSRKGRFCLISLFCRCIR